MFWRVFYARTVGVFLVALLSCKELPEGRSASIDEQFNRTYVRKYRSITSSDHDGPLVATATSDLPGIGESYVIDGVESDAAALVKSVNPDQDGNKARHWVITVTYSSKFDTGAGSNAGGTNGGSGTPGSGGADPATRVEDPLSRPVEWRLSFDKIEEFLSEDLTTTEDPLTGDEVPDPQPIENSAGMHFDPPLSMPRAIARITCTKNYSSFPFPDAAALMNRVNSDPWMDFAEKTCLIDGLDIVSCYENGVSFVRATYTILVKNSGWIPTRVLDRGSQYKDPSGELKTPRNKEQDPLPFCLLDSSGNRTTTPHYLEFVLHRTTSFAAVP